MAPRNSSISPGLTSLGLAVCLVLLGQSANSTTRLVPEQYATIQQAIDASTPGDTVLLAPGVYRGPGNRDIELRGIDLVLTSVGGPDQTIIDCEESGRGFYIHESETEAARVEGITIQNGRAPHHPVPAGGGIYCSLTSVTIADCRILNNVAMTAGGIYLGVFHGMIEGCVIAGNSGYGNGSGGLTHSIGRGQIRQCLITGNWGYSGGGVAFDGSAANTLVSCTIAGNLGSYGGGIESGYNTLYLDQCVVRDNCAFIEGDDVYGRTGEFRCCCIDTLGVYLYESRYYEDCIFSDPVFCEPHLCGWTTNGDWSLGTSSPCLPGNSPCGQLIGALGIGCGVTPSHEHTWGGLKALFRSPAR